jgi:hypothetical protein
MVRYLALLWCRQMIAFDGAPQIVVLGFASRTTCLD